MIYTRRGREALALTFSLALQSGTDGLVSLVRTVVIVCSARRPAAYVRNDYKTNDTYGRKTNVLTNPKLLTALNRVLACQKHHEDCGVVIKNPEHLGYYVQQATYNKIGEG